jgi:release factor glutamine methyltransferase
MSRATLAAASIASAAADAAARLAAARIPESRREARLLLSAALAMPVERLLLEPERRLPEGAQARLQQLLERRAAREPLAQILGCREFWSLGFAVTRDTLVPRPETESLVEAALALVPDGKAPLRLLDLGTGSGCILLSLLSELPRARGVGSDACLATLQVARQNARDLGLGHRADFIVADWGQSLAAGAFDLVLSNPPYIREGDIDHLEPEIRDYEPRLALVGGPDGLDCYRKIAPALASLLRPGGQVLLELGRGQATAVTRLMNDAGLKSVGLRRDLAGISRCLIMRAATAEEAAGDADLPRKTNGGGLGFLL